jgi:hypothetical protein
VRAGPDQQRFHIELAYYTIMERQWIGCDDNDLSGQVVQDGCVDATRELADAYITLCDAEKAFEEACGSPRLQTALDELLTAQEKLAQAEVHYRSISRQARPCLLSAY